MSNEEYRILGNVERGIDDLGRSLKHLSDRFETFTNAFDRGEAPICKSQKEQLDTMQTKISRFEWTAIKVVGAILLAAVAGGGGSELAKKILDVIK
jgi:hypothetical protein